MAKELPKGWIKACISDIFDVRDGTHDSPKYLNDGYPLVTSKNIKNGKLNFDKINFISKEDYNEINKRSKVDVGDVLFSMIGTIGSSMVIIEKPIYAIKNVALFKPLGEVKGKFLKYYLATPLVVDKMKDESKGTTQKFVSLGYLRGFQFPLPPLPEQQRIVAKLDTLFGHLDALKTRLDHIPQLLKDFRQKVLTQAVTGKLTEEWREGKELENEYDTDFVSNMRESTIEIPELWYLLPFESIATIKSNLVDPNKYLEYPLIAPDNIQSETGLLINKPLVSDIMPISSKHIFEKGSIVYSKIRPYLSKLVIVDFDGLCSADMYPIISDLETKYLFYYMLSEHFLSYATTAGERTVLPKINQKGLNEIPVPVPPREEQQEIVRRVESLFAKAEKIEASYQKLKVKIEQLPQALLAKAFRGELVEQLPTDGDARELLEVIRKAKAGLEKGGRTKKMKENGEVRMVAEDGVRYGKK